MREMMILYLLLINAAAFLLYREDKKRAKRRKYRIPEVMLIGMAVLGGSIGAWAGMHIYRHKTKHWKFKLGVPLIFFLQLLGMYWLCIQMG